MKILFILFISLQLIGTAQLAGTGSLTGEIRDAETLTPLQGAVVRILGSKLGASSNDEGKITIPNIAAGNISVVVSYIGYNPQTVTDVIIRPGRETAIQVRLMTADLRLSEVVVTAEYFKNREISDIAAQEFSYEEIRRSPGSYGDISRVLYGMPSAAKVSDEKNTLMIRGGSPAENGFYVDNIEIPNINHFPVQGTSGGAISFLNIDFIQNVEFSAGGFSPEYGGKMSSIMDIRYREGSRSGHPMQLNLDFSGFGGIVEGSFGEGKLTYMLSARRSYLDYLVKAFDAGSSIAPEYGDMQGKLSFDINPENKLSVLFISAYDKNHNDNKTALENDMIFYGDQTLHQSAFGFTWRKLWNTIGYTETSISTNSLSYDEDFYETGTQALLTVNNSIEREFVLRSKTYLSITRQVAIELLIEGKRLHDDYYNEYASVTNPYGSTTPGATLHLNRWYSHQSLGLNLLLKPIAKVQFSFGVRADDFAEQGDLAVQPRAMLSYTPFQLTTFHISAGIYKQPLPKVLLAQSESFSSLPLTYSEHYIAGIHQILAEDTKLTFEGYVKRYKNLPYDPQQSGLMLLDEAVFRNQSSSVHDQLTAGQTATSYGIEINVQKKLNEQVYGLVGGSIGKSEYTDNLGIIRNRSIDNRYMFSIEGGYKPWEDWEFSLRWVYAGGRPYTPFDENISKNKNEEVYDLQKINSERMPAYHSLNVRVDRRWNFSSSSITAYISIWNAYNRKNIAGYFWDKTLREKRTLYQFGILPVFGVEYEL